MEINRVSTSEAHFEYHRINSSVQLDITNMGKYVNEKRGDQSCIDMNTTKWY